MRLELDQRNSFTVFPENATVQPVEESSAEAAEHLRAGIKAAQAGNRTVARAELIRSSELDPRNESVWLWLSSISEYPEELLAFLSKVLELNPENARALEWAAATKSLMAKNLVQRGIDALESGQRELGVQLFEQALDLEAGNTLALLWMASAAVENKDKLEFFEKALQADPENETALAGAELARANIREGLLAGARAAALCGDLEAANRLLENIFDRQPGSEDAWVLKSHITGSLEEKVRIFHHILEINPQNAIASVNLESLSWVVAPVVVDSSACEMEAAADDAEAAESGEFNSEQSVETEIDVSNCVEVIEAAESEIRSLDEIDGDQQEPGIGQSSFQSEIDVSEGGSVRPFESAAGFDANSKSASDEQDTPSAIEIPEPFLDETNAEGAIEDREVITYELADGHSELENDLSIPASAPWDEAEAFTEAWESESLSENGGEFEHFDSISAPTMNPFDGMASENDADLFKTLVSFDIKAEESAETQNGDPVIMDGQLTAEPESAPENAFDAPFDVTMYGGSNIPMPGQDLEHENLSESKSFVTNIVSFSQNSRDPMNAAECPFCQKANDPQAISCNNCMSILTLADLEMVLANHNADKAALRKAVEAMERERSSRDLTESELTTLGIGHLNLRNLQFGYNFLLEASQKNPNNVVLSGQVNALLIRLEEIKLQAEAHETMLRGKKILVVDDSPTVRKLIAGKLEKCGHEVHCSSDGVEAMDQLQGLRPDLVLLDINMPRMDGYQVCKLIRNNEETKDVPVVMISGKDGFFDKVRGRMAGTSGYITKPFGPETLMKAVESFLSSEG